MGLRGQNKKQEMQQRIDEIEQEFGEPMADIVTVMRQQGCNWETIRGSLEIGRSALDHWRREFGFCEFDRSDKCQEVPTGAKSIIEDVAHERGFESFEDMYREYRYSRRMTLEAMSRKTGIPQSTISMHRPRELDGIVIETKKLRESRVKNIAIARSKQTLVRPMLYSRSRKLTS